MTETDILREALRDGLVGWAADVDATAAALEFEKIEKMEEYAQRVQGISDAARLRVAGRRHDLR